MQSDDQMIDHVFRDSDAARVAGNILHGRGQIPMCIRWSLRTARSEEDIPFLILIDHEERGILIPWILRVLEDEGLRHSSPTRSERSSSSDKSGGVFTSTKGTSTGSAAAASIRRMGSGTDVM